MPDLFDQSEEILSVSELTKEIKITLEEGFSSLRVVGEISNFKAHYSGHWYFTLKDSGAQINCTMWKGVNNYVFFTPQDGMKVVITGRLSVYPPRGTYQLDVRSMKHAGEGELQIAFEKLKKKLSDEGLFRQETKQPIPRFPEKIGIVTAIDGAALKDMINVASRRFPLTELVVAASKVQGEGAAATIVKGIEELSKRDDIDVMIVGRGGGSLEDLWAFNEEEVARAIFASRIPIISGVGHEIDFTIADFVADFRAPTPSAAMELATPDKDEIFAFIDDFSYTNTNKIFEIIRDKKELVERLINSYGFRKPDEIIKYRAQIVDNLIYRIENSISSIVRENNNKLDLLKANIKTFDINSTLQKGFVLVHQEGKIVKRASDFERTKNTKLKFYDNEVSID